MKTTLDVPSYAKHRLTHHVIKLLLLIKLALLLGSGILVLLVLRDQIVHVGLSLSELHLIHTLTSVPVKERLSAEHGCELLRHTLPHLLDSGGVAHKSGGHLQTLGRDITDRSLHVVRDPLHEVGGVLVDNVEHLLIHLFGGHAATEHARASQVATVARISSAHHVLGVELLLGELRDGQSTVLLRASGGERSETNHEKVKTREGDHVHSKLAKIAVELTREAKRASGTGDSSRHQVVKISISGGGEFEGSEADIVQGLVIKGEALVSILDKLVHGKSSVVRLHHSVGHLGGRHDGVSGHDSVRVFLTDL
mmetsp:Transcript_46281/g.72418  ORF Transcript_46281/g.72418 Transcript_46281/m.72418 type:complete len:310 (+) Transcript_46281:111-1040(+)